MELVIKAPNDGDFIKVIEFNKDEVKQYIEQNLEKYKNLIYDDYSIKSAKTDRATLNNFKAAIESKRKEIKKKYLEPYEAFERDIKELTSLIDKPMLAIDAQVKAYEDRTKDKKRLEIETLYQQTFEGLHDLVPLGSIFDSRWLNATTKLTKIGMELTEIADTIRTAVKVIKGMQSEFETELLTTYFRTRDLEQVLVKAEDLKAVKAAVRVEPPKAPVIQEVKETKCEEEAEPVLEAERKWYDFSLYLSNDEIMDLKEWIRTNNIKIRKVEK